MNWKIVGIVLLVLIIGLTAAMIRQHERYLDARRNLVQDYQNPWHGDVFHVLTYLSIGEDSELIPVLRNLSAAAAEEGNSQLIYAGKVYTLELSRRSSLRRREEARDGMPSLYSNLKTGWHSTLTGNIRRWSGLSENLLGVSLLECDDQQG